MLITIFLQDFSIKNFSPNWIIFLLMFCSFINIPLFSICVRIYFQFIFRLKVIFSVFFFLNPTYFFVDFFVVGFFFAQSLTILNLYISFFGFLFYFFFLVMLLWFVSSWWIYVCEWPKWWALKWWKYGPYGG